jgi:hypothetical protein
MMHGQNKAVVDGDDEWRRKLYGPPARAWSGIGGGTSHEYVVAPGAHGVGAGVFGRAVPGECGDRARAVDAKPFPRDDGVLRSDGNGRRRDHVGVVEGFAAAVEGSGADGAGWAQQNQADSDEDDHAEKSQERTDDVRRIIADTARK